MRPKQAEVVHSVLARHNTIATLPTGAGKSLCFQLPACIFPGTTLVISPLLALMHDQVRQLKERGIAATTITSELSTTQTKKTLVDIAAQKYKLVYCSPEKLQNKRFAQAVAQITVPLLVVDEAHCICEWGHDFRPAYRNIQQVIRILHPSPVILAVTATASKTTLADIQTSLNMHNPHTFTTSPYKSNISLNMFTCTNQCHKLLLLLRILQKHTNQSGVLYCSTRKRVEQLCAYLNKLGMKATQYHGKLSAETKKKNAELFLHDAVKIIVATSAFGMGIDKPNVRFVVHFQVPQSVEQYTQEVGRAGRDKKPARAYLLSLPADIRIQQKLLAQHATASRKQKSLKLLIKIIRSSSCIAKTICKHFGFNQAACKMCSHCIRDASAPLVKLSTHAERSRLQQLRDERDQLQTTLTDSMLCLLAVKKWNSSEIAQLPGMGDGWINQYNRMIQYRLAKDVV